MEKQCLLHGAYWSERCPTCAEAALSESADALGSTPSPEEERNIVRAAQAQAAMVCVPWVLEAWDDLPNDVKQQEELRRLAQTLQALDDAMIGEASNKPISA